MTAKVILLIDNLSKQSKSSAVLRVIIFRPNVQQMAAAWANDDLSKIFFIFTLGNHISFKLSYNTNSWSQVLSLTGAVGCKDNSTQFCRKMI